MKKTKKYTGAKVAAGAAVIISAIWMAKRFYFKETSKDMNLKTVTVKLVNGFKTYKKTIALNGGEYSEVIFQAYKLVAQPVLKEQIIRISLFDINKNKLVGYFETDFKTR